MLEEIRNKIMDKNVVMRQFAETWISDISHMARLVLEENKDLLDFVRFDSMVILDMKSKMTYNHFLQPIPNMKMWPHTRGAVIEPPEPKVMLAGMGQHRGHTSRQPCSSHPPVFIQPSNSKQPPLFSQPSSSNQPPVFSQQSSSSQPPVFNHQGSSMCFDFSAVKRKQQPAKSRGTCRGIGRGTAEAQPGTSGERVITPGAYKDATPTNIEIGYKPRGLKWNGGDVVITSQLQRMSQSRKNKCGTSSEPRNA
ncbi:hypothetical protein H5410_047130 [Solanum commersonii]|uniref:Uncharacterized protein n=1 Tax=Solanum commersonii TaxID=4109 RepID=A0A9J5XIA7_SOLCO|nr:hypothetical protein H5410_047130 [Solanum commersonii]